MAITKIGTPELFDFSSLNTALQLPTGPTSGTGGRPSSPSAGEWRFNTTLKYVEYWDGGAWRQIDTEALPTSDDFPSQNFNVNTYSGTGATQTIDAKFNEAANFNGTQSSSGSKIDISQAVFNDGALNTFSVSAWFKSSTTSQGQVILGTAPASSNTGFSMFLANSTGYLRFQFSAASGSGAPIMEHQVNMADGNWHNAVLTYNDPGGSNNASSYMYVDGVNVTSGVNAVNGWAQGSVPTWSSFTTNRVTIGMYFDGSNYIDTMSGFIDQVRIFNTTLTDAQAEDCWTDETTTTAATLDFPSGAGCIAAYQLDGDASDLSGTYGGVTTNIGYTGLRFQPDFVWTKNRGLAEPHMLYDSLRGVEQTLYSNDTDTEYNDSGSLTNFNSNGFSLGTYTGTNRDGYNFVAWCFKAGGAPTTDNVAGAGATPTAGSVKIDGSDLGTALAGTTAATRLSANTKAGFSIVKFPATNTSIQVAHGLNSAPELIIWKNLDTADNWYVYNKDLTSPTTQWLYLNLTNSETSSSPYGFSAVTSTTFTSHLWAGSGTNNIISYCFHSINGYQKIGTYTGTGSDTGNYIYTDSNGDGTGTGAFEPAFLLVKRTDTSAGWFIYDNKRMYGSEATANPLTGEIRPNENFAEDNYPGYNFYTNGFEVANSGTNMNASGGTYIFLAIAANKDSSVPTQANSFSPTLYTGNATARNISTPFAPDFTWIKSTTVASSHGLYDTIRGGAKWITSNGTNSTQDTPTALQKFNPNGFSLGDDSGAWGVNASGATYISWNWKAGGLPTINNDGSTTSIVSVNQAAGFSIVRYKGNNAANQTVGHGLGTGNIPKLIIFKKYSGTSDWPVYSSALTDASYRIRLNDPAAQDQTNNPFNGTAPTDEVFTVAQNAGNVNDNGQDIIAYCFADVSGYQQIGSYAGNTVTNPSITTGFSPSFVVIKQINGSNPWVVIDSARSPSNPADCRLRLNATDTEYCLSTEAINRSGTGFEVDSNWDGMNGNGNTYLYWAVK